MELGIGEKINWFIPFDPEISHLKIYPKGKTEKHKYIYMERYSLSYNSKSCPYSQTIIRQLVEHLSNRKLCLYKTSHSCEIK